MFNAKYFTYDGVCSDTYGLVIADFNSNSVVETSSFSPTLNTIKPATLNRFFHNGIKYDSVPQYQFSIISEAQISDELRREILSWLVGRNEFKKLQVHQDDLNEYYYNCVFTNAEIIYVNGHCHGFRITANFDSSYARGASTEVSVGAGTHNKTIYNNSDVVDDYVYPIVEFNGGSVRILNKTDDENRWFEFSGLEAAETITVDNEIRYIKSSIGGEKLSNFTSKNWLRLRQGQNDLTIEASGDVKITCPNYVMIGY